MANLRKQKELAARSLGVSKKRIKLNINTPEDKKSVQEMISRENAKELLGDKVISKLSKKGISRTRANYISQQKKKGRRAGQGSRKGTANARLKEKSIWMTKIRGLRAYLKKLKEEERITIPVYRELYKKAKGNFFRNKRHIQLYMEQNELLMEAKKDEKQK